jgi:hypothetical protein
MLVISFVIVILSMSISHSQYPDLPKQFRVSVKLEQMFTWSCMSHWAARVWDTRGLCAGAWSNKQAVIWQHSYRLHTERRWFPVIFGILSLCVNTKFGILDIPLGAGITQSVQRLVTDWTREGFGFWISVGSRKNFLFSSSTRPVFLNSRAAARYRALVL